VRSVSLASSELSASKSRTRYRACLPAWVAECSNNPIYPGRLPAEQPTSPTLDCECKRSGSLHRCHGARHDGCVSALGVGAVTGQRPWRVGQLHGWRYVVQRVGPVSLSHQCCQVSTSWVNVVVMSASTRPFRCVRTCITTAVTHIISVIVNPRHLTLKTHNKITQL